MASIWETDYWRDVTVRCAGCGEVLEHDSDIMVNHRQVVDTELRTDDGQVYFQRAHTEFKHTWCSYPSEPSVT